MIKFVIASILVLLSGCGNIDVEATIKKYDCHRTGEFAGKDAQPIYQCGSDPTNKYTYYELFSLAIKERK